MLPYRAPLPCSLIPLVGLEPTTPRLEVECAVQLRHKGVTVLPFRTPLPCSHIPGVGFEPTKQPQQILSLPPLTELGNPGDI